MSLADELTVPRPEYMPAPFWFWNDVMDPHEVRRQVAAMARQSIGGFFMHARMGRATPYMSPEWMEAIRAAVDEARKLHMHAWIYDEDGWPSGYGGGLVNALGDEYLQKYTVAEVIPCRSQSSVNIDRPDDVIAVFTAHKTTTGFEEIQRIDLPGKGGLIDHGEFPGDHVIVFRRELYKHRRYFSPECWTDGYVDILDPKVTRAFIREIYEPYRREIGRHFGTTVPGVFTDEPNYHDHKWGANEVRLPMSPVLDHEFEKRYGAPLADSFVTIAFGGPDAIRARWCYYTALAHLFANNFTRILAEWCEKHGLIMTGHYLLEEAPRFATQVVGDVMQHYAWQQYPGIDHLGRDIELDTEWTSSHVLVKQAASVAHQLDKPRVMCETYAGGGWDFGPRRQKWMGDWQYALGMNLCCQHAFHYSLRGFRKRDYPPSLSFQQPWFPLSADLGAHFSRLGYLLTRGRRVVNVLVLHPIESFFATHDVAGHPWPNDDLSTSLKSLVRSLLSHQIDFDFGNEVLMKQHGRVEDGCLAVGSGRYSVVIVPHSVTWRRSTLTMLREFTAAGGRLFAVEPLPTHVEGKASDACASVLAQARSLGRWSDPGFAHRIVEQIMPASDPACRLRGAAPENREVLVMHRRADDQDIFFLASGMKEPHAAQVEFRASGTPMLLDTVTGKLQAVPHSRKGPICEVSLPFDCARSFPIIFEPSREAAALTERRAAEITLCTPGDRVPYQLDRDNALILDWGELEIDRRIVGRMFVLDAEVKLARVADATPICLRFRLDSEIDVPDASLLLETPKQFGISVDGRALTFPDGEWVVDPCLRRAAIPGGLHAGTNTVELRFRWHEKLELEPLYVLGRFGVEVGGEACRMTALPEMLRVASWHDQGLAFYAGCVTYGFDVAVADRMDRWELYCPGYNSVVRVSVNSAEAGTLMWAPHCVDVTDHIRPGRNRIELRVANSLRNFLGPHHLLNEDEIECLGPSNFFDVEHRCTEYRLKPTGLMGEVVLRGYRRA